MTDKNVDKVPVACPTCGSTTMPNDDDKKRFEEERRRQAAKIMQLEQGFLGALTAWLTEEHFKAASIEALTGKERERSLVNVGLPPAHQVPREPAVTGDRDVKAILDWLTAPHNVVAVPAHVRDAADRLVRRAVKP